MNDEHQQAAARDELAELVRDQVLEGAGYCSWDPKMPRDPFDMTGWVDPSAIAAAIIEAGWRR